MVLVGAEAVVENGGVINKLGSYQVRPGGWVAACAALPLLIRCSCGQHCTGIRMGGWQACGRRRLDVRRGAPSWGTTLIRLGEVARPDSHMAAICCCLMARAHFLHSSLHLRLPCAPDRDLRQGAEQAAVRGGRVVQVRAPVPPHAAGARSAHILRGPMTVLPPNLQRMHDASRHGTWNCCLGTWNIAFARRRGADSGKTCLLPAHTHPDTHAHRTCPRSASRPTWAPCCHSASRSTTRHVTTRRRSTSGCW